MDEDVVVFVLMPRFLMKLMALGSQRSSRTSSHGRQRRLTDRREDPDVRFLVEQRLDVVTVKILLRIINNTKKTAHTCSRCAASASLEDDPHPHEARHRGRKESAGN
jgi:hypothetical protein